MESRHPTTSASGSLGARPLRPDHEQTRRWRARRAALTRASPNDRAGLLAVQAREVRRSILRTIAGAGFGHVGGDLSVVDILTVLFEAVLAVDPSDAGAAERDRFILSKGHCAASLYCVLAQAGLFSPGELATFMASGSPLNGHPSRLLVPGVEASTGSLGHGLPVAVGTALGLRLRGHSSRVFVVLGDGELQEGSNWEALMAASHFKLSNLTVVIDRNHLQQGDRTERTNALEPLTAKLTAFGLQVREVDGHDHLELLEALTSSPGAGTVGFSV
jgi:transketolase